MLEPWLLYATAAVRILCVPTIELKSIVTSYDVTGQMHAYVRVDVHACVAVLD